MLSSCRLSSKGCLQMCVESLLDNLKKYPMVNMDKSLCIVSVCVWGREGGALFF